MTYTHGTLGGDRGKTVPGHERMEKEIRQIRKRIASKPRDEDLKRLGVLEAVKGAESDEDPSEAVAADQRRPVPRGKGMRAVRERVCYSAFKQDYLQQGMRQSQAEQGNRWQIAPQAKGARLVW